MSDTNPAEWCLIKDDFDKRGRDLGDFSCRDADIRLSGASRGTIRATGTLDAALSGASSLGYKGNPTLGKVSTSGAASIKKQYIPSPFTYQKFKRICREWSRDRGAIQRLRSG